MEALRHVAVAAGVACAAAVAVIPKEGVVNWREVLLAAAAAFLGTIGYRVTRK